MNTLDLDKIDLSAEAPVQEPERQYYFMAKLRALVRLEKLVFDNRQYLIKR